MKIGTFKERLLKARKDLDTAYLKLEAVKKYGTDIKKWPSKELLLELFDRVRRRFR
jgi:hypothetical protein